MGLVRQVQPAAVPGRGCRAGLASPRDATSIS